jgi:tetratricopeptide (TPR) repeat protein
LVSVALAKRIGRKKNESMRLSLGRLAAVFLLGFAGCQTTATVEPAGTAESAAIPSPRTMSGSYLIARQAYRAQDLSEAASHFEAALNRDPENRTLIRRTFLAELEYGSMPAAIALAERAERAGDTAGPFMPLALALHSSKTGSWAQADERLLRLPKSRLNEIIGPLLAGWLAAGREDWAAAHQAFAKVAAIPGFEVLALLHSAHARRLEGNLPEADKAFEQALIKGGKPPLRLSLAAAIHYAASRRPDEARRVLSERTERDHDAESVAAVLAAAGAGRPVPGLVGFATDGMAEALFDLASALQRERGNNTAMIMAQLAIYMRPTFPLAQLLVGEILDDRGRHEDALRIYRRIPDLSAYHTLAQLRAAASLQELGRAEESVAVLRELADRRRSDPTPWIRIGDQRRAAKQWVEAVDAYDQALQRIDAVSGGDWSLFYTRGIALERAKRWQLAEVDFLKALELAPDQPYVMNYLGYSWTEQGVKLKQAERMIAKAVELRPKDGYIIDSLGWILYRTGRFEEAVTRLEQAVQLRPNDPTINDHLGDAYWRVGRRIEASFQWRRALTMEPEADLVTSIQNKLKQGLPAPEILREGSENAGIGRDPDA